MFPPETSPISLPTAFCSTNLRRGTTPVVRLGSGAGVPGPMLFAFLMLSRMAITLGHPNNNLFDRNPPAGEYPEYNEYMSYTEYPATTPVLSFQTVVDTTTVKSNLTFPLTLPPHSTTPAFNTELSGIRKPRSAVTVSDFSLYLLPNPEPPSHEEGPKVQDYPSGLSRLH